MMRLRLSRALLPTLVLTILTATAGACGRGDQGDGGSQEDGARTQPNAKGGSAAPAPGAAAFAFTQADLDAYERGMKREIELVRAAKERERKAKSPQERFQAVQAQWEDQTIPGGAKSAGIPEERYRRTRETVDGVLQTLDFQGKIDGPMSMDTARATPEMKERLRSDPFAALPPASAAALRARLNRLVPVWVSYVNLTAIGG